MNVVPFIASCPGEALGQIRAQLGPDAVVLSVRRLPARGLGRLWRRHGPLEVLAGVPEAPAPAPDPLSAGLGVGSNPMDGSGSGDPEAPPSAGAPPEGAWRSRRILERLGLLPVHAARILDTVRATHGDEPPASLPEELALCYAALAHHWRHTPSLDSGQTPRPQVLIGPPGSGKTTALCKWLANAVLLEGRTARVWRLDTQAANTAESLSVYGDVLGVPVERLANGLATATADLLLVDLPGVDPRDRAACDDLAGRLRHLPHPQVHLVLNAAYGTSLLLAQARTFAGLASDSLIVTHLDEEPHWGKLWNLVLGTNFTLRFLGAGQNIPGRFLPATPEWLLPPGFGPDLRPAEAGPGAGGHPGK